MKSSIINSFIIFTAAVAAAVGIVSAGKINVHKSAEALRDYGESLRAEYSDDGFMPDYASLDEALDRFEEYASANAHELGVRQIERTDSSVVLKLRWGATFVFAPLIKGTY